MKLIALVHDGDCADCSYTPLQIPDNLDVQAAKVEYQTWRQGIPASFLSFADWLVQYRSAQYPEIEEYDAD